MLIPMYCAMNSTILEKLHMSEERVAPGNLHYFYSKTLDDFLARYLSHMIMVAFESHHMYSVMDKLMNEALTDIRGFARGSQYHRCVEQRKEKSVNDIQLTRKSLEHTVLLLQTAIVFATFVWVIELYLIVLFRIILIQRPLLRAVRRWRRKLIRKLRKLRWTKVISHRLLRAINIMRRTLAKVTSNNTKE